jgi:negative regulator of flagellin synthesis FlgM
MKIVPSPADSSSSASLVKNAAPQKQGQGAPATATTTASQSTQSAGVAVTVSNLAKALKKPEATQPGDIDTAKVASVKSAIQDGTYVVNAEAIADKLLTNAQEMFSPKSS